MALRKFPFEFQLDTMDRGPACLKIIAMVVYKTSEQKIFVSVPAKGLFSHSHEELKKRSYKEEEEACAIKNQ